MDISAKNELIYHCSGPDCEYICILEKGANEFECPRCNTKACPECRGEVHKGISCEEFK